MPLTMEWRRINGGSCDKTRRSCVSVLCPIVEPAAWNHFPDTPRATRSGLCSHHCKRSCDSVPARKASCANASRCRPPKEHRALSHHRVADLDSKVRYSPPLPNRDRHTFRPCTQRLRRAAGGRKPTNPVFFGSRVGRWSYRRDVRVRTGVGKACI